MPSRDPDRPNVIVVLTDDQGCWAMRCAGNAELQTPNLDRLAASGMRFDNFFCTSPVCSPARASILTGRMPSAHGIHDWLSGGNCACQERPDDRPCEYLEGMEGYTDILARGGYACGLSGKWHLGASDVPQKGFTYWNVHARGGGSYYGAPLVRDGRVYNEPRYVTDAITDNALAFLDQRQGDARPFYLSVHYTAPHSPWGREHHPHDIFDDYHEHCAFRSVPKPRAHPWSRTSLFPEGEAERRLVLSGYFTAVTAMDRQVGRLLDRIEQLGLRDDTLVVFTSDNGMNMGHHGIYGKGNGTFPLNMYDTSVKVPMLISRPGSVPAGATCDTLLSHYDIMPTLLDYAGIGPAAEGNLPGHSFAPLLEGKHADGHSHVVVYDEYGPARMVRNHEWKYVHRYPYGPHELYDLAGDPGEEENRIADTGQRATVEALRAALDAWFSRHSDPARDGRYLPVTGAGQFGAVGTKHNSLSVFRNAEFVTTDLRLDSTPAIEHFPEAKRRRYLEGRA